MVRLRFIHIHTFARVVFAAVAGDDAGMVVVFQIEHVPRPTC